MSREAPAAPARSGRRAHPGTKRVRYLEENVASLGVVLDAGDLDSLERAVARAAVSGDRYGDMAHVDS